MIKEKETLVFVYNADSTVKAAATGFLTRVFAPSSYSCNLCAVTHTVFDTTRSPWQKFLDTILQEKVFLHRDEFQKKHPNSANIELPVILRKKENILEIIVSAGEINKAKNVEDLINLLKQKL